MLIALTYFGIRDRKVVKAFLKNSLGMEVVKELHNVLL